MEYILAPCTRKWADKSCPPYGIQCDGEPGACITHMVWADNVVLISGCADQMQNMIDDVTESIYANNLAWKSSSLQFIVGGTTAQRRYVFIARRKRAS